MPSKLFIGGLVLAALIALVALRVALAPSSPGPGTARSAEVSSTPRPVFRFERYVHSPVNVRRGPGEHYPVVSRLERFVPVWAERTDSVGWVAVFGSPQSRDTLGYVLARLLRANRYTDEEIRLQKIEDRRSFAETLERSFLEQGLDVRVTTAGRSATTLRMEYVLFSRVWAYHFRKQDAIWVRIKELGFRRVEMTNGDYSWTWTVN